MIRIGTVGDTVGDISGEMTGVWVVSGPQGVQTQVPRPRRPVGAGPSARPGTV